MAGGQEVLRRRHKAIGRQGFPKVGRWVKRNALGGRGSTNNESAWHGIRGPCASNVAEAYRARHNGLECHAPGIKIQNVF